MSKFKVTANSLNLRSQPKVNSRNRIAVLPNGQQVEQVHKDQAPWWFVETVLHGVPIRGYVHANYLLAVSDFQPPTAMSVISPVHLKENLPAITRAYDGGRAYPLGEAGMPRRNGFSTNEKVSQMGGIVDWLAVDRNERYLKNGSTTYCNIYAYDYCYLCEVYIPRVWWTEKSLLALAGGNPVETRYGETVKELNANALHDWFEDFGMDFGWRSSVDVAACQDAANKGKVAIACAKRDYQPSRPHLCHRPGNETTPRETRPQRRSYQTAAKPGRKHQLSIQRRQ